MLYNAFWIPEMAQPVRKTLKALLIRVTVLLAFWQKSCLFDFFSLAPVTNLLLYSDFQFGLITISSVSSVSKHHEFRPCQKSQRV